MGEFWDTHDFTEFDTDAPDAHLRSSAPFPSFSNYRNKSIGRISSIQARRPRVETLVNQWLQQKIDQETVWRTI